MHETVMASADVHVARFVFRVFIDFLTWLPHRSAMWSPEHVHVVRIRLCVAALWNLFCRTALVAIATRLAGARAGVAPDRRKSLMTGSGGDQTILRRRQGIRLSKLSFVTDMVKGQHMSKHARLLGRPEYWMDGPGPAEPADGPATIESIRDTHQAWRHLTEVQPMPADDVRHMARDGN